MNKYSVTQLSSYVRTATWLRVAQSPGLTPGKGNRSFSFPRRPDSSGAHPAYSVYTGVLSWGVKPPGRKADYSRSSAEVYEWVETSLYSPYTSSCRHYQEASSIITRSQLSFTSHSNTANSVPLSQLDRNTSETIQDSCACIATDSGFCWFLIPTTNQQQLFPWKPQLTVFRNLKLLSA